MLRRAVKMAPRYFDIGANLTDKQFQGFYHGRQHHDNDLDHVLDRATQVNVQKTLVTGSTLEESHAAIDLCKQYPNHGLYCTVGVHPCHATDFAEAKEGAEEHLNAVEELALKGVASGVVKAFGEIGLDYDRLHFAPADAQREYFHKQLAVAAKIRELPLFLHSRACADDFVDILSKYLPDLPRGGVVHSFTGTSDELQKYLSMSLYIGINGCSLKTQENLDTVKEIPLDRLLLETDGPWCEIRPSHASYQQYLQKDDEKLPFKAFKKDKYQPGAMVRGRCEPCSIDLVARVVAGVKGITVQELTEAVWDNTCKLFGFENTPENEQ